MEKEIEIDGQKLHYDETGDPAGKPIVLMHGYGCNISTVRSIAACLEDGMHVYSLDLPGHGKSPEPPEPWGVEEYTRLVEKFIEKEKLTKPALIGHSFGGRLAILLSSRNNTGKVVLVDAAGVVNPRPSKTRLRTRVYKLIKKSAPLFGKNLGGKIINWAQGYFGSADYKNSTPMMRAVMSKHVNTDLRHVMPSIKAPTLLIWGEQDTATPLSDAKAMEKLIPDAGLVSFAGCGHYSFLDNPGGFRAVVRQFFKDELNREKN